MKAILYNKGGRANACVTEAPDPTVGDKDVLIRVYASDICRPADAAHDGGYSAFGKYPLVPGHEYAGIVEKVGKDVVRFQVGDRVTADANLPCGTCYYCIRGEVQFCENNRAYGQSLNGGFAQLVAVDESLVYKVPDSVSLRAASMTELVGCVYNCMERCNFKYGSEVLILGGAVGAFMILVARPVTVFACLLPFRRFTTKARLYVSWVGLRGAVPILFAIYPMMAGVEHAELLFNVVFLSTIISLLVQGTTVSGMANLLGLAYEERESAFNVEMHEEMKSALTEVEVNENLLASGHTLKDITLPENTLVMMVCRDGEYFVPQGKTELKLGDKLLVISDRSEELASTYKDMGIDDVMKLG